MIRFLLAAAILVGFASGPVYADVVLGGQNWSFAGADNLVLSPVVPSGNQPQNIQCVICGENQPQQSATFGYTDFHNTGQPNQDLRYFSTAVAGGGDPGLDAVGLGYDGSFLRAYLLANGGNLNFSIGIDVNDSAGTQVLESFYLLNLTQHKVLAVYSLAPGGTPVPAINDGTGFPDYTLTGFNIDVIPDVNGESDLRAGDQLIFFARLSNGNDGPDSFFLVPTQAAAVPGPIAGTGIPGLVAALIGMFGLSRYRRRRNSLA